MDTDGDSSLKALRQELDYYKRHLEELSGKTLRLDYVTSKLRYQLEQKRRGFALLSELQRSIGSHLQVSSVFEFVMRGINAKLGMDRSVALVPTEKQMWFRPSHWSGFTAGTIQNLPILSLEFPEELAGDEAVLLVNRGSARTPLIDALSAAFELPYFVCVPVIVGPAPIGLLIAGRQQEDRFLCPPLDQGDVDTLRAIAGLIAASVRNMRLVLLERRVEEQMSELSRAGELQRFLPEAVVQGVLSGALGPAETFERRKVTVVFADMVGFTDLADRLEPEELAVTINQYFRGLSAVAISHGGSVDRFAGDGLMVLFGAPDPLSDPDQAWAAVCTALSMRARVEELTVLTRHDRGTPADLAVRIGMNSGYCTVGVFGSEQLRTYTALGLNVNVAARLETTAAPGSILCGFRTWSLVQDRVRAEPREPLLLKGMSRTVDAYEILGLIDGAEATSERPPPSH